MKRILVTGATGNIGGHVLAQLPPAQLQIRALVRNPDTARLPAHVDTVYGDLTRPETLDECLIGVDTIFLVWVAPTEAVAPALERIARRVQHIVLLSAPLKTAHPFFQQPNPSRTRAELLERHIENSGVSYTFLRPGMFAGNAVGWWAPQIRAGDTVRWPLTAVPTAPVDERDVASVAVRALCEGSHSGAEYVLTGPHSLTQQEQIAIIGSVLRRPLRIEELSPQDWLRDLPPYVPPVAAKYLLDAWTAAIGQPAFVTSTVAELTGAPARTFHQWATDNAARFAK